MPAFNIIQEYGTTKISRAFTENSTSQGLRINCRVIELGWQIWRITKNKPEPPQRLNLYWNWFYEFHNQSVKLCHRWAVIWNVFIKETIDSVQQRMSLFA